VSGDRISLHGIRAYGRHGAVPGEREMAQPLDIDLEIEIDLSRPRASDALADTLDYSKVHETVTSIVRDRSFVLLERLGDEIVRALLADERVRSASVTISKPNLLSGATPSVTLRGKRD
jgi:dihydroneopterin aldolase